VDKLHRLAIRKSVHPLESCKDENKQQTALGFLCFTRVGFRRRNTAWMEPYIEPVCAIAVYISGYERSFVNHAASTQSVLLKPAELGDAHA